MIRFESVSKKYPDGTVAVDELSVIAPSGQITVFVGPSGCGKTTSLRMINRMIEPTSGQIWLDDKDTVIRWTAAQRVSSALEGPALDEMLTLMRRDRFMPVRRESLRIRVSRAIEQGSGELLSALLDTHASMRAEARYKLQKLGPLDVAAFYRQALTAEDPSDLYSAISGLGETGSAEDCALVIPFASNGVGRIRRAAIRSLARLNKGAHLEVLIEGLTDTMSSVSSEALKALADSASLVGNEILWEIFCSTPHSHVKRNALSLLERLGKWDCIYFMVKLASNSDDEIATRARRSIQHWLSRFNSTFYTPAPAQISRLRTVLEECGDHLDERSKEELRFSIRSF